MGYLHKFIIRMNKSNFQATEDNKCKACALFFGYEAYQGLCSTCFKYLSLYPGKMDSPKRKKSYSTTPNSKLWHSSPSARKL